MSNHSNARPHTSKSTNNQTISEALKRRAEFIVNDKSVDAEMRALIRYAIEINDPSLAELVRRADAAETFDNPDVAPTSVEKIEALVEIICGGRHDSPAALLVLMATLESASEPAALAHAAKQFAFTLCGELNVCGMVDAQTARFESELLADRSLVA